MRGIADVVRLESKSPRVSHLTLTINAETKDWKLESCIGKERMMNKGELKVKSGEGKWRVISG